MGGVFNTLSGSNLIFTSNGTMSPHYPPQGHAKAGFGGDGMMSGQTTPASYLCIPIEQSKAFLSPHAAPLTSTRNTTQQKQSGQKTYSTLQH